MASHHRRESNRRFPLLQTYRRRDGQGWIRDQRQFGRPGQAFDLRRRRVPARAAGRFAAAFGDRAGRGADGGDDHGVDQHLLLEIPAGAPVWEKRGGNFDVLSFAGTTDRIGVTYTVLGYQLESGELYDLWTQIETTSAADLAHSRAILERHLIA